MPSLTGGLIVARGFRSKVSSICLAIVVLSISPASQALSVEALVLGDSIGEGLAKTVGLRHIAKRSFSLRRGDIGGQLAQLPSERVGLMSLGLNDAIDPVEHLSKSIEKVIQAATSVERKLVWIGPPCVLKNWDNRAAALDAHLKQRLAATSIQYVSLRDEKICAIGIRTRDGEHFTLEGYRYVWEKIRRDSPFAASIVLDPCETARAEAMYRGRKPPQCGEQQARKN